MVIIYRNKTCIDCNNDFLPTSGVQLRCGSYKLKTGCNYEHHKKSDRESKVAIRAGTYNPYFTQTCIRCSKEFISKNTLIIKCEECKKPARLESRRIWHKNNRPIANSYNHKARKLRYYDNNYMLKRRVARKLRTAIKKNKDISGCIELDYLGCTIQEWKQYIESKFTAGMSWNNYGKVWDIDHILPFSSFDLNITENIYKAFHYTNTQPLDSYINRMVKKSRIDFSLTTNK